MLKAIIGTLLIASCVTIYACLRVSSKCSRQEEKEVDYSRWCDLDCYRCEGRITCPESEAKG